MSGAGGKGGAGGGADVKRKYEDGAAGDDSSERKRLREEHDEKVRTVFEAAGLMTGTLEKNLELKENELSLQAQLNESQKRSSGLQSELESTQQSRSHWQEEAHKEKHRANEAYEASHAAQEAHDIVVQQNADLRKENARLRAQVKSLRAEVQEDSSDDDVIDMTALRAQQSASPSGASGALTGRVGVLTGLIEGAKSIANAVLQTAPVRQSGSAAASVPGTGSNAMQVDQISVQVLTAGGAKAKQSTKGDPSKELAFNDATGKWHPEVLASLHECVGDTTKVIVSNNRFKVNGVDYTNVKHDAVEYRELDAAALTALKKLPYEICLVALGKVRKDVTRIPNLSAFMLKNIDYLRNQWGLDDGQSSSSEGNTESDSDSDEEEKASSASDGAGGAARDDAHAAGVGRITRLIEREPGEVYVMSVDELTVKYTLDPTQPDPANLPRNGYVDMVCSKQNVTVPSKSCWGCFAILGKNKNDLNNPKAQNRRCGSVTCKKNRTAFQARRAAAKKANAEQVPARDAFPFEDPV
tara:strand:+ start:79 stop:1659 length:1581 start_codon:yes stop_codon:yes gene_type:complete